MLRILRAFAWLRWRILLNSLERRGSRDVIERFSLAIEQLAPTIALLVLIPSAVALASLGGYAGWSLARGQARVIPFELLRFALFGACALAVFGPVVMPAGDRTNAVRVLLLPIPRSVLYVAHAASSLADPWILLAAAALLAIAAGLAAGGAGAAAIFAAVAGLTFIVILGGLTMLATTLLQLIVRDRRRGEALALVLVLVLPALGVLPGLLADRRGRDRPSVEREEGEARRPILVRIWRGASTIAPSEVYARTVRAAARADFESGAPPLVALAAGAALLHVVAYAVYGRMLRSPGTLGASRRTGRSLLAGRRVPGLSAAASAVAVNQLQLALRTPRGRSTLLSPIVVFVMLSLLMSRSQGDNELTVLRLGGGLGLAAFTSFVALLATLPLAMNQFAIDRAGLTMMLLAPLPTRTLLAGKAVGNALIAAIPAALCLTAAAILFPVSNPGLWAALPLTLLSVYLLAAPAAAVLSAIFPRAVDLNSIGGGSNAHGAAGLLGMLAFVFAALPPVLILLAAAALGRPMLGPALILVWAALCAAVSPLLFAAAAATFDRRRENLAMVV